MNKVSFMAWDSSKDKLNLLNLAVLQDEQYHLILTALYLVVVQVLTGWTILPPSMLCFTAQFYEIAVESNSVNRLFYDAINK